MRQYPTNEIAPDAGYKQGLAYLGMGRSGEAKRVFQRVISKHPENLMAAYARLELAEMAIQESRFFEASEQITAIIESRTDETAARGQYLLGEIAWEQGDTEEALTNYLKVKYIYPSSTNWVDRALLKAGACYEKMGESRKARKVYDDLLTRHKEDEIGQEARRRKAGLKGR